MLPLHQREVAAGRPLLGPGVAARRKRRDLGIRHALRETVARAQAIGVQMIPPALGEIGPKILPRPHHRMDVAIDDADRDLGAGAA